MASNQAAPPGACAPAPDALVPASPTIGGPPGHGNLALGLPCARPRVRAMLRPHAPQVCPQVRCAVVPARWRTVTQLDTNTVSRVSCEQRNARGFVSPVLEAAGLFLAASLAQERRASRHAAVR